MRTLIVLSLFNFIFLGHTEKFRYDNFQVYRVTPLTEEHLTLLHELEKDTSYEFWTNIKIVENNVDIMVPPHKINYFNEIFRNYNLPTKLFINNVQRLIDNERGLRKDNSFAWDDYHTLEEINEWLISLTEKYPDKVTLQIGGKTYEGRSLTGVHLSFAPGNENKSIFIEGNIHACEWISSAVVTYFLNELLTSNDTAVRQIAESHDWYVFPVVNPDGFAFSHSSNRTWRKTRVPYEDGCYGADPNRNWDYHYNEGGTTEGPCSIKYAGPQAFSEPCTKSFSEYLLTIGSRLEGYFAFHSYAQILLLPYGYTEDHLDNYDELYNVGSKGIKALAQRYGTEYKIGNVAEILYIASGGSPDWVKGNFGTKITYTYELRDTGTYGFLLPADQIIPTAEETFDSFITILQEFAQISRNH